jgi:hypothetical protein
MHFDFHTRINASQRGIIHQNPQTKSQSQPQHVPDACITSYLSQEKEVHEIIPPYSDPP